MKFPKDLAKRVPNVLELQQQFVLSLCISLTRVLHANDQPVNKLCYLLQREGYTNGSVDLHVPGFRLSPSHTF